MTDKGFPLHVSIPADEWAMLRRRLRYVEAALVQVLRNSGSLKEWFTAAELAELRLPGLPTTPHGIIRRAQAGGWRHRLVPAKGGERREYHFTILPRSAFEEVIRRAMTAPGDAQDGTGAAPVIPAPPKPLRSVAVSNATPPWLLSLMRVIRGNKTMPMDDIMNRLPANLPDGVACPTSEEIRMALRRQHF